MKKIILLSAAVLAGSVFADWSYDASAKTITDNNWVLTVSKSEDGLSVSKVVSVTDPKEIDLSQKAVDGEGNQFDIIAIGNDCFSKKEVEVVRLGDQIKSLGQRAFYNCTALKEVTPLMPASLTKIGQGVFSKCSSLEGDVVFPENVIEIASQWHSAAESYGFFYNTKITSCDMSKATMTTVLKYSFSKCTQLKTVKLPKNIEYLGEQAFAGSEALTKIEPFLPDTLTRIGACCFKDCISLEGDLVLGGSKPVYCDYFSDSGQGVFRGCSKIKSAKILSQIGLYKSQAPYYYPGELSGGLFYNCKGLVQVEFYEDVLYVTAQAFVGCSSLTNVIFHGTMPTTFNSQAFGTKNPRIFYTRFDDTWSSVAEKFTTFTEMNESLEAEYRKVYPEDKVLPLGKIITGYNNSALLWISDVMPGLEENVVYVESSLDELEISGIGVAPDYGVLTGLENGTTKVFTAPENITTDSGRYKCVGYTLSYEMGVGSREFSTPVINNSTQCTITQQDNRVWRLIWLWETDGYKLNTNVNDVDAGNVTCSPEAQGTYDEGAVVNVTASPKSGYKFLRWYGDVPKGKEFDRTITVTMDQGKSVTAVFSKPWSYDTAAKTITDGNWVLSVTGVNGVEGGLQIGKIVSVVDPLALDLSQSVNDSSGNLYNVVAIAENCFSGQSIRFLDLGDEIKTIGHRAFSKCYSLEWAFPLMPAKLTSFGEGVFSECILLSGDVVFPGSEIATPNSNSSSGVEDGWFYKTKITSCDMSKATMITIANHSFSQCTDLKSVKMPNGIKSLGNQAFNGATALLSIEPFLPNTLTSIGFSCFQDCSNLEGDLVINGDNPITAVHNSNNISIGAFAGCGKIKSAKLLVPAVNVSGTSYGVLFGMFNGCTALESVELCEGVNCILEHSFNNCKGLKDITFLGPVPTYSSSSQKPSFSGVTDKQIRFHVSKKDATWQNFRVNSVTPMNEALIAEWETIYPGEARPKGQFVLDGKKMWLCPDFGITGFFIKVR